MLQLHSLTTFAVYLVAVALAFWIIRSERAGAKAAAAERAFERRMTTDTHAPYPRWQYLLDKLGHTAVITLILVCLVGVEDPVDAALLAALAYVVMGQIEWWWPRLSGQWTGWTWRYRAHVALVWLGDALYHSVVSAGSVVLIWGSSLPRGGDGALLFGCWATVWLVLELSGLGPMRDPSDLSV